MKSPSIWGRFDRPEFGEAFRFRNTMTCACGSTLSRESVGADTAEGRQAREAALRAYATEERWDTEGERCPECRVRRMAEGTQDRPKI